MATQITIEPWERKERGFCMTYDLVIGGTLFPHHEIQKLTWYSPSERDESQIDHLMINRTWRRMLQEVTIRGGVGVGSDHHGNPGTEAEEKWTWQGRSEDNSSLT